jgi:hypothetical protein
MRTLSLSFFFAACWFAMAAAADPSPVFDEARTKRLAAGEALVLDRRPDETGEELDARFVTTARLIEGSRETIWEVINDKDHASEFLEGVLESKVLEREGNRLLVEQRTHVGGPKGDYRYRLWHELTPMSRATFTYAGGELSDVIGAWWIFDGPVPGKCLVVYSLHIDAGFFAPQAIVKAGMKKTMPRTMASIAAEVARRNLSR